MITELLAARAERLVAVELDRGLAAELQRAGLREIGYLLTAGGIVVIHFGTVPGEGV